MDSMTLEQYITEFKDFMKRSEAVDESAKGLVGEDPDARGGARSNLNNIINNTLGPQTVIESTSDSEILRYAPVLRDSLEDMGVDRFKKDPKGIINKLVADESDRFSKLYAFVKPYEVAGNDGHNALVKVHTPVYALSEALKNFPKADSAEGMANFISGTTPILADNLIQYLSSQGVSEDKAKYLASVFAESYQSSNSGRVLVRANHAFKQGAMRLQEMIPENERAAYAERNLVAAVDKGDMKDAAKGLYKVLTAR